MVAEEERKLDAKTRKYEQNVASMEQRVRDLNTAPGAIRADNVAAEEAKRTRLEIAEMEFRDKFPQYSKLNWMIYALELGMLSTEETELSNKIITEGKKINPNFTFSDLLLPYLTEKELMGILIKNDEHSIYQNKLADICAQDTQNPDIKLAQYLKEYLKLNAIIFAPSNQNLADFAVPFKRTLVEIKSITAGLGTKLLAENKSSTQRR